MPDFELTDDSEVEDAVDDLQFFTAAPAQPKRKGRPPKKIAPEPDLPLLPSSSLLRPTGNPVEVLVASLVVSPEKDLPGEQEQIVEFFLSPEDARPMAQVSEINRRLGRAGHTVQRHEVMLAGACLAAQTAMVRSSLSTLDVDIRRGELCLLAVVPSISFDETPLKMRGERGRRKKRSTQDGAGATTCSQIVCAASVAPKGKADRGRCHRGRARDSRQGHRSFGLGGRGPAPGLGRRASLSARDELALGFRPLSFPGAPRPRLCLRRPCRAPAGGRHAVSSENNAALGDSWRLVQEEVDRRCLDDARARHLSAKPIGQVHGAECKTGRGRH